MLLTVPFGDCRHRVHRRKRGWRPQTVEVVNQSYEADHDAPTRPLHGTIEKARSGRRKNWCSQDPLLTASEPTAC